LALLSSYRRPHQVVHLVTRLQPLLLSVDIAIPCGLVLNELVTNALKHAFNGTDEGRIEIELSPLEGRLQMLRVRDNGPGKPEAPSPVPWLGMRLVRSLARQLDGHIDFTSDAHGTTAVLTFSA
jgi:two-component sensor histidine kinase